MVQDRRVGLFMLVVTVFVSLLGATQAPLNPLVIRNEQVRVAVPSECEEGLSPAPALRVNVSEIPLPPVQPRADAAPPTDALRGALQETQTALTRNNRPAFDEALARLKSVVESYPTGGERRAAEQIVAIFDAAARLWDAQYVSPFFGEDSAEYALASGHPGYSEAVRRATFTDDRGRRFYPAAESREFLAGVAAQRLQRLGVSAPAPSRRTSPAASVARSTPRSTSSPRLTQPGGTTRDTTRGSETTTARKSSTSSRRKRTAPSGSPGTRSRSASRKPAAVTHTPSSSPTPLASPTSAAVPAPAAPRVAEAAPAPPTSPAAGDDAPATSTRTLEEDLPPLAGDPLAGDTAASDTVAPPSPAPTTSPATTGTTGTAPGDEETPSRTRSVVLPMILILIGLGVLIVLFRASK